MLIGRVSQRLFANQLTISALKGDDESESDTFRDKTSRKNEAHIPKCELHIFLLSYSRSDLLEAVTHVTRRRRIRATGLQFLDAQLDVSVSLLFERWRLEASHSLNAQVVLSSAGHSKSESGF